MSISIRVKHRPFSLQPKTSVQLPWSPLAAVCYPTKIVVGEQELLLESSGGAFAVHQDIDRGFIRVQAGCDSFRLRHEGDELILYDERRAKEQRFAANAQSFSKREVPRLSFGIHKKQDVELMRRRNLPEEVLPHLVHLGLQMDEGELPLLSDLKQAIETREGVYTYLKDVIQFAFEGLFVPKGEDDLHTGQMPSVLPCKPYLMLASFARIVLDMFFKEEDGCISLLARNIPEFHCGRIIGMPFALGTMDIEWTKKKLRRVVVHPKEKGTFSLKLPCGIRRFRMGNVYLEADEAISIPNDGQIVLDRFEK